jgi:hypothetical protein
VISSTQPTFRPRTSHDQKYARTRHQHRRTATRVASSHCTNQQTPCVVAAEASKSCRFRVATANCTTSLRRRRVSRREQLEVACIDKPLALRLLPSIAQFATRKFASSSENRIGRADKFVGQPRLVVHAQPLANSYVHILPTQLQ